MTAESKFTESIEFDDETVEDVSVPPEPRKHTLLQVWREVLGGAYAERYARIPMQVAVSVIGNHQYLQVHEVPDYFQYFYDIMEDALKVVYYEIDTDPDALDKVEDDGIENRAHYLNIIVEWSKLLQAREQDWNIKGDNAPAQLAAYIDGANALVGSTGLLAHLGEIEFEYTEDDREMVRELVAVGEEG